MSKILKGHDGGKTFDIIYRTLTEHLGYTVYHKIIDAQSVVPQHRERIFFVAFREWWKSERAMPEWQRTAWRRVGTYHALSPRG